VIDGIQRKTVENYRGKEGFDEEKIFKGGLRDLRLTCGWIVVCDMYVIVL
jgi:hypothetical protein